MYSCWRETWVVNPEPSISSDYVDRFSDDTDSYAFWIYWSSNSPYKILPIFNDFSVDCITVRQLGENINWGVIFSGIEKYFHRLSEDQLSICSRHDFPSYLHKERECVTITKRVGFRSERSKSCQIVKKSKNSQFWLISSSEININQK